MFIFIINLNIICVVFREFDTVRDAKRPPGWGENMIDNTFFHLRKIRPRNLCAFRERVKIVVCKWRFIIFEFAQFINFKWGCDPRLRKGRLSWKKKNYDRLKVPSRFCMAIVCENDITFASCENSDKFSRRFTLYFKELGVLLYAYQIFVRLNIHRKKYFVWILL